MYLSTTDSPNIAKQGKYMSIFKQQNLPTALDQVSLHPFGDHVGIKQQAKPPPMHLGECRIIITIRYLAGC